MAGVAVAAIVVEASRPYAVKGAMPTRAPCTRTRRGGIVNQVARHLRCHLRLPAGAEAVEVTFRPSSTSHAFGGVEWRSAVV